MIGVNIFVSSVFASWIQLCILFSMLSFAVGSVYFAVAFLIKAQINLEGKIRNEKVWREALSLYLEKKKLKAELKEEVKEEDTDVNS